MKDKLYLEILPQPNDTSCGPTSLHSVYRYFEDPISLTQVINEVPQLENGGTLGVMLGLHALNRGYSVTIYTYNLQIFDPSWFPIKDKSIVIKKLLSQLEVKNSRKMKVATDAYIQFLEKGGDICFQPLSPKLIKKILSHDVPILTGLSSTFLYGTSREVGNFKTEYDDIAGTPTGHFVVIADYNHAEQKVLIADPLSPNPMNDEEQFYHIDFFSLINAILLGVITYDANLLLIRKKK